MSTTAKADTEIDKHLDAVLRASGSALRHFTSAKTIDDMRSAMREYAIATLESAQVAYQTDAEVFRELLDEVRRNFTRDDDLPNNLLPRIDAAMLREEAPS